MKKKTIGDCTLYCGDCFAILPKLDVTASAVISDPPFGITACDWDTAFSLAHFWDLADCRTKPTANFVLFGLGKFAVDLIASKYRWYRYDLIWAKNNKVGFLNANRMPMRNHEQIFSATFSRNRIRTPLSRYLLLVFLECFSMPYQVRQIWCLSISC